MDAREQMVRRWVAGRGSNKRRRVPAAVRSAAMGLSADRRADGATWQEVARELGLGETTLQRWASTQVGPNGGRAVSAVPVVVASEAPRTAVVLVSPRGFRLEGLCLEDAARVLQVLG